MPNTKFDAKSFNPEVFAKYMRSVPDVKRNKLLESGAISGNEELRNLFSSQTGSYYGRIPFYGNLDQTEPDNYDGQTDITADSTVTFEQGVFVYGRAKGWTEKDFSSDITAGVDFMANIRSKLLKYWYNVDQDTLLAVLEGLFGMTGAKNQKFVDGHTLDISGKDGEAGNMSPTTLNTCIQQACGDNKEVFTLAIMHSVVATNLENMKLLEYLKYTDAQGMQRDLGMGTWNGRLVIVDDSMPVEVQEAVEESGTKGQEGYVAPQEGYTKYTTYILGNGAINLEDIGAKVPYEMDRNPKVNGGEDTLYTRHRKAIAVPGFSYEKVQQASLSPTRAEIANPTNWTLIHDGAAKEASKKYYDHKAIAIARIISKG